VLIRIGVASSPQLASLQICSKVNHALMGFGWEARTSTQPLNSGSLSPREARKVPATRTAARIAEMRHVTGLGCLLIVGCLPKESANLLKKGCRRFLRVTGSLMDATFLSFAEFRPPLSTASTSPTRDQFNQKPNGHLGNLHLSLPNENEGGICRPLGVYLRLW